MARPDKAAAVAELVAEFRDSSGAVLTDYRGLTVKQLQELRRALGDNATYAVVKNTLTKIAANDAGIQSLDGLLAGPSAIAFLKGDPVEAAKSLRDFSRANESLVIKGGILDGKPLSVADIAKIADLESREVLLPKLAGALVASLQNAVSLFNAPLASAARLIGALQAKAEQDAAVSAPEPEQASPPQEPSESTGSDLASPLQEPSESTGSDLAPPPQEPSESTEPADAAMPAEVQPAAAQRDEAVAASAAQTDETAPAMADDSNPTEG